jgi:serine/threonine protein kinase
MAVQSISHYRVLEKLGEGGMGVVYRALDLRLDRQVALKVIGGETMANPDRKNRFVQEARAASALNHPNIVTIYEIDSADVEGKMVDFIAMEYVRGRTLQNLIPRKKLKPSDVLKYAVQIADALGAAHAAGIVHRDVKPANLMVTDAGQVKILDFGLAKLTERFGSEHEKALTETLAGEAGPTTEEGKVFGTVAYMSPEQAEGHRLDARSDIFSFGSVLYEMATGQKAFQGASKISTLASVIHQEPTPPREIAGQVSPELERIILICLRKDKTRRFQHMQDLRVLLQQLKDEFDAGKLPLIAPVSAPATARSLRWIVPGLALALAAGAAYWLLRPAPDGSPVLDRLTWDDGLTADPSLSPDGRMLAYSSDRAGERNLDIWVQQLAGGASSRLTTNRSDDTTPDFSPDGANIAFQSDRDGGGIYTIPTVGGQERLIARRGNNPRYSPDGSQVAYWTGEPADVYGKLFVVSTNGSGQPVELQPEFVLARYPVWTPDGKHILFEGRRKKAASALETDWFVTPLDGGPAVQTGASAVLQSHGLFLYLGPGGWRGDRLLFSARAGATRSLYEIAISPSTFRVSGVPHRLTLGTGVDAEPYTRADGRIVFASLDFQSNLWTIPIAAARAAGAGPIERLSQGSRDDNPSVSGDGSNVVFVKSRPGNHEIWLKDIRSGRETALTDSRWDAFAPVMAADGSKAAYALSPTRGGKTAIHVVPLGALPGSSVPELVCEDCGPPTSWSQDGSRVLYVYGEPPRVGLLNVATRQKTALAAFSRGPLRSPQFSPDGRWIAAVGDRIYLIPFRNDQAPGEKEWIPLTDGAAVEEQPHWSPDGTLVYFYSRRDGFGCLWAQRFDPASGKTSGAPVDVSHFHSSRLSMSSLPLARLGICVSRDKLILNLVEVTGGIWSLAERPH